MEALRFEGVEDLEHLAEENKFFEIFKLPYELQMFAIARLRYPDLMDFCKLGRTTPSKKVAKICGDNYFWEIKTKRDFSARFPETESRYPIYTTDWKSEYIYYLKELETDLVTAMKNNNIELFYELLEFGIDPSVEDNKAIRWASFQGNTEIVKMLLEDPRVDPSAENNWAIQSASIHGHTEVVRLLLEDPRVDPSANNNQAIIIASLKEYKDIVKLLLEDERMVLSADEKDRVDRGPFKPSVQPFNRSTVQP